jgi:signal transduction histidine kinase
VRVARLRRSRLSTRLALLAAAVVCLAVGGFAVGAYQIIAKEAREALDESLQKTADEVVRAERRNELGVRDFTGPVAPTAPEQPQPKEPDTATPPGTKVQVQEEGKPVREEPRAPAEPALPAAKPGPPRTIKVGGEEVRVVVRQLPRAADGRQRTVLVARSTADVETTLDRAAWSLGLGGLAACILALGLAWLMTRRTLRPLVEVQGAAEQVAESRDLSLRIEEGNPDEVGRLARSMNLMLSRLQDAQDRLTAALDEQRRFAADASHELRTPLTALKGDIDLLARHPLPADEQDDVLEEMAASVARMNGLVQGLLALARADGTSVEGAAAVDLRDVLGEVGHGVELVRGEEPAVVRAQPEALRALFGNLLDNARRHGDEVRVTLQREGPWAAVVVADNGPGVAQADRERIFDRFYRSPALRGTPGSGLGLAIARSAAEKSGGSLTLLPTDGRGAAFEVRLPLVRAKPDPTTRWAQPRVLRAQH